MATDTHPERCDWCGKSVAGDAGANLSGVGDVLCFTCRTDEINHKATYPIPQSRFADEGWSED
jgi:hypothetical protein